MSRKYRVVAWGTGGLGRDGVKMILQHPDLELVGAFTSSPDKVGRDAAELVGEPRVSGVAVTDNANSLLALNPDCIAYFANSANRDESAYSEMLPFLRAGTNLSTISHFDVQYPRHGQRKYVSAIEEACQKGGSSVYLTGDDPGWAFGHILFGLLSVAGRIDRIDVGALAHVRSYTGRKSLEMYGFNQPLDFRPPMFTSQVGASWHIDTLRGVADFLGVEVEEYRQEWQTAAVDFDFDCTSFGTVKAGQTAAAYWTVTGIVDGKPFLVYHKLLRLHETAGPDWPKSAKATGRENTKFIRVTGDPDFETEITRTIGMGLTPVSAVTAIPWLCNARPGILTQADVPLFPARNLGVPSRPTMFG